MASLLTHTHGRHVPHVSYASLLRYDVPAVTRALAALPQGGSIPLHFDALGCFRRSRCRLAPAVTVDLASRHQAVVAAVLASGAELHRNYRPGVWTPHLTLAPRLHLEELPRVAGQVDDVLHLAATATRAVLIDTSTGERHPLPHLV